MKKLFTLILFVMILLGSWTVQAQRAPLEDITRNLVVVEIGTYLTCGYCPGAAMGADDLVENGHPVAIVENHQGDAYSNTYSHARNSLYGITGYPTAFFDGTLSVVGGSGTNSMYGSYVPKVNARMDVLTPFDIDFTFTDNGGNNYTVSADISKVGDYTNDVVLHVFVTESHIPENWGGLDEVNFVNRLMAPDQNGTSLDFSNGNDIVEEVSFDMDANWDTDNCEIVVAIQDMSTKEILNAGKAFLLQPTNDYDAAAMEITQPEDLVCGNEITPQVIIRNYGGETLTSLDIEYSVNGGDVYTYTWTGSLDFLFSAIVDLPSLTADLEAGDNSVDVTVSNPNGQDDADPSNNSTSHTFEYLVTGSEVVMECYLGSQYAEELSWALYDPSGNILAQDSYTSGDNGSTITETFTLTETGCHSLVWSDSYGDGFNGGGWCKLKVDGNVIYTFNSFSAEQATPWFAQIGDVLEGPIDPMATADDFDITFEWEAPAKATLLGYNIYEQADMETPINTTLIEETSYLYTVETNGDYQFYFSAVYEEGESDMVGPIAVDISVGIMELQNNSFSFYPNPAKDILNMNYSLTETAQVSTKVYSISGALVIDLEAQMQNTGTQTAIINTKNLGNGIYFIQLEVNGQKLIKKFSIVK